MSTLKEWLYDNEGGPAFTYLTAPIGWLPQYREIARTGNDLRPADQAQVDEANEAVRLYLLGRVELVQRKGVDATEYIAVRRNEWSDRSPEEVGAWRNWQRDATQQRKRARPRMTEPAA